MDFDPTKLQPPSLPCLFPVHQTLSSLNPRGNKYELIHGMSNRGTQLMHTQEETRALQEQRNATVRVSKEKRLEREQKHLELIGGMVPRTILRETRMVTTIPAVGDNTIVTQQRQQQPSQSITNRVDPTPQTTESRSIRTGATHLPDNNNNNNMMMMMMMDNVTDTNMQNATSQQPEVIAPKKSQKRPSAKAANARKKPTRRLRNEN